MHSYRTILTFACSDFMSPKYAMDDIFAVKSNVSFGVLVLEIISSKKNKATYHAEPQLNLLSYVSNNTGCYIFHILFILMLDCWLKYFRHGIYGKKATVGIAWPIDYRSWFPVRVGLLCVQKRAKNRPDTSLVLLMLGVQVMLSGPNPPGLCTYRSPIDHTEFSLSCTVNDFTVTTIEVR